MSDLYRINPSLEHVHSSGKSKIYQPASRSDVLEWLVRDRQSLLELRKALRRHGFEEGLRAALIAAMGEGVGDE